MPAVASLAAIPAAQSRTLLSELANAHLITEHTPGRYSFHDLLRVYATEQAQRFEPDTQRQAALHRLYDHYLHTAYHVHQILDPDRDDITLTDAAPGVVTEHPVDARHAAAWFTAEYDTLLEVTTHAAHNGSPTHTWQLAWCLTSFFNRQCRWQDRATVGTLAVAAAEEAGDQAGQARACRNLGYAEVQLRRYDDAHTHLQQALDLFGLLGDRTNQALTHLGMAWSLGLQYRYRESLDHAQRSVALFHASGHQIGQARALTAVGSCHARLGDLHQALAYCQRAVAILHQHPNWRAEVEVQGALGHAYHQLGDYPQALDSFQQALDLCHDQDDRYRQAAHLALIGDTHDAAGDPQAARAAWQPALTLLDQLAHPDADAVRAKLHHLDHPDTAAT